MLPASPTTPSPQLSQRLTGPARPGRESIQPKSGSPQAGQGGFSGPAPASSGTTGVWPRPSAVVRLLLIAGSVRAVQLSEIMTAGVVTADQHEMVRAVAEQMRDHRVGSVVLVDSGGAPVAMVTDRDLTVRAFADDVDGAEPVDKYASRPLVCGEPTMELEEAAALMVQHRVRRLPVVDAGRLAGIVTLDDIAVRTGNLEVAQKMTAEVIEGALPQFYFHERG
jgi:CBS domain-containing protein